MAIFLIIKFREGQENSNNGTLGKSIKLTCTMSLIIVQFRTVYDVYDITRIWIAVWCNR